MLSSFKKNRTYAVNRSLYMTSLRRYWPGSALMMLVYLIAAMIMLAGTSGGRYYEYNYVSSVEAEYITGYASVYMGIFAMIAGLIAAMLCMSYLMNHREVIMMHSLPIKRESHLISATASGMTLLGAPIIAGGILFFAVYAVNGYFFPIQALHWTAANLTIAFFSFCISAFFAMLTGNAIAHGILTLIFTNLPIMVEAVFKHYCERFLYGFIFRAPITRYINPIYQAVTYFVDGYDRYGIDEAPDFLSLLFFTLIGAAFLILAAMLYRRRGIESAGDVIALRQVRPFLRYGAALGFAFLFGIIYEGTSYSLRYDAAWEIFFSIIGGAFGFFMAEMFIRRTIYVFRRHYAGAIGFALVFTAVFLTLYADLPGYGSMKLDAGLVEFVVIDNINYRVRAAVDGEPLDYEGTIADLNIDDPGGYLAGRSYKSKYIPKGRIPRHIAEQILERDTTVLHGGDALEAVAFQNYIAQNAKILSGKAPEILNDESRINYSSYYDNIPIIARYKDGRVFERNYTIRLNKVEDYRYGSSPVAEFNNRYYKIRSINQAAGKKRIVNCAARAVYLELEYNKPSKENYTLNNRIDNVPSFSGDEDTGANEIVPEAAKERDLDKPASTDENTVYETIHINLIRGEWDGLFEANELDGRLQTEEDIMLNTDDLDKRGYGVTLMQANLTMPDGYTVSARFKTDDANTAAWLIQRGYIGEDALNAK